MYVSYSIGGTYFLGVWYICHNKDSKILKVYYKICANNDIENGTIYDFAVFFLWKYPHNSG